VPFNLAVPNLSSAWSLIFSASLIQTTDRHKTIVASSLGGLIIYTAGDTLTVKIGPSIAEFGEVVTSDSREFAIVYNGLNCLLYIDGIYHASEPVFFNNINEADLYIGSAPDGQNAIDAFLAKVRFFDVALSQDQIVYYSDRTPIL
jgi:hypothetical protein